jgi:diguanylate cyclase (GGDEF)-like protein
MLLLTPFMLNHLRQGRIPLGIGTLVIVLTLTTMAWLGSRGRHYPWLTFLGLPPAVLVFILIAFREQAVIGALWCYPAVLTFYFTLPEKKAWAANAALYAGAVPMAWLTLETSVAARVAATLLGVSVFSAIFVRVIDGQHPALQERAVRDSLTGLHNRTLLATTLEQATEQARRSGTPMTLLALDLDDFKAVNDEHGHLVGDDVLRGVADVLRARLRKSDLAFRLGGEEFLAFLYGTDEEQGRRVAEELRAGIEARPMIPSRPVTVSIGVASFTGDEAWEAWMRRCDRKLYDAKARRRNRIVA